MQIKTIIIIAAVVLLLGGGLLTFLLLRDSGDTPAEPLTDESTAGTNKEAGVSNGSEEIPTEPGSSEHTPGCDEPTPRAHSDAALTAYGEDMAAYWECLSSQADSEPVLAWVAALQSFASSDECQTEAVEFPLDADFFAAIAAYLNSSDPNNPENQSALEEIFKPYEDKTQTYITAGGSEACLTFVSAFISLPSLQRGAQNTQRRADVSGFHGLVNIWISNNNGGLPSNTTDLQNIASQVSWGYYNGENPEPLLRVANDQIANTPNAFNIRMITSSDESEPVVLDAITDFYLPGRSEIHLWLGKRCKAEVLTAGNDKDLVTTTDKRYATGDILPAHARDFILVYQLEGESQAHCIDDTL